MTRKQNQTGNQIRFVGFSLLALTLILLWRGTCEVGAQSATTEGPEAFLEEKINAFFNELRDSRTVGVKTAMENLFRDGSRNVRVYSETIETLERTYAEMRDTIGEMHSWEMLKTQKIGSDIVLFQCVAKHENSPVLWYFTFYQSPHTAETGTGTSLGGTYWNINHVRFDTNLEPLFLTAPTLP